jgi:hypothetical protein
MCSHAVLVFMALTALAGSPSQAEQDAKRPASAKAPASGGQIRVDGKVVTLSHGYLLRAPDAFTTSQRNSVVLVVPQPLDKGKLDAAKTLREVLDLTKERMVLEFPPDGNGGKISLCHESFGPGMCYSTDVAAFTFTPGVREQARVSGRITSFGGKEETVLETKKLFFDVTFDVEGRWNLSARR